MLGAPYVVESIPTVLGEIMFWCGIVGLIGYPIVLFWQHTKATHGRMTPQFLIIIGLAGVWLFASVALAGVVWQHYQTSPASSAEQTQPPSAAAQQVETTPTRHYSSADKDRIAEAFHQLREILNNEADPLQLEVQRIWQGWSQRQSKPSDTPLDIDNTIERLAAVRAEAARLSNVMFKDTLNLNKSYEPLLKSVLAYRTPDPLRELYQHADRIRGALESTSVIYQDSPNKPNEIATVVLRILDPFAETNSRVNGWIHDTLRRIEEQEKLVLSRG